MPYRFLVVKDLLAVARVEKDQGDKRLYVSLNFADDVQLMAAIRRIEEAGFPVGSVSSDEARGPNSAVQPVLDIAFNGDVDAFVQIYGRHPGVVFVEEVELSQVQKFLSDPLDQIESQVRALRLAMNLERNQGSELEALISKHEQDEAQRMSDAVLDPQFAHIGSHDAEVTETRLTCPNCGSDNIVILMDGDFCQDCRHLF